MQEDREFAEVEGRITAFTSPMNFALDGLPVNASGASVPAGLALGVQVEVKGSLRGGVLVASRVELEAEGGAPRASSCMVASSRSTPSRCASWCAA